MPRRLVFAGLAALLAAPALLIAPAEAAVLFSCDSVTGSATLGPGLVHDKRAQILESGPNALAGPADITLASITAAGVKGNRHSTEPSLSGDGIKVAFVSDADNLDPDWGYGAVYVKDVTTGELTLVASSSSGPVSLSADGTTVAFTSFATDLDPADTDTIPDVYVGDLTTGDITLASTSDTGVKGNGNSGFYDGGPTLSGDGTKVAFHSRSTNLDPADLDSLDDVYVKDLTTGELTLASISATGVKGNGPNNHPTLSNDGGRVAFNTTATNLDPRDTDNFEDVYVKDLTTGDLTLASTSDAGVKGNDYSFGSSLSADGTRVAFSSAATNLDPGDTDGGNVYVKDLSTGDLTLASTSDSGVEAGGTDGSLSADGTRVAFATRANLDPVDTFATDIYVKDLTTGNVILASTSDTGVKANAATSGASLSADGTAVAFQSQATTLDPADTESRWADIYVKDLPTVPTSIDIAGCSNGNSGTASVVDIRSYGPRPLGCPTSLGGAAGNDYADTTPILVGATLSMTIDWASGPNSYGVAAAKAGPTGTQWRFRLAITASPGHDTPATNQYLPAVGSGFVKTRLQGKLDVGALDSFDCATGTADPLSWLSLANNGSWVAKNS
jgi:hypothetical protein